MHQVIRLISVTIFAGPTDCASSCRPKTKRLDRLVGTRSTVTNGTFNADFLKQQKIVKLQPIITVNGIKYWGMSQPVSALKKKVYLQSRRGRSFEINFCLNKACFLFTPKSLFSRFFAFLFGKLHICVLKWMVQAFECCKFQ